MTATPPSTIQLSNKLGDLVIMYPNSFRRSTALETRTQAEGTAQGVTELGDEPA